MLVARLLAIFLFLSALTSTGASAAANAWSFTFEGALERNGAPFNGEKRFLFQIRVFDGGSNTCLLYEEEQTRTVENGQFTAKIGEGTPTASNPGLVFKDLYSPSLTVPSCTLFTVTSAHQRLVRVFLVENSTLESLGDLVLTRAPAATQAAQADSLGGKSIADLLQVTTSVNQADLDQMMAAFKSGGGANVNQGVRWDPSANAGAGGFVSHDLNSPALADDSVGWNALASSSIPSPLSDIITASSSCSEGKVLKRSGTAWTCSDLPLSSVAVAGSDYLEVSSLNGVATISAKVGTANGDLAAGDDSRFGDATRFEGIALNTTTLSDGQVYVAKIGTPTLWESRHLRLEDIRNAAGTQVFANCTGPGKTVQFVSVSDGYQCVDIVVPGMIVDGGNTLSAGETLKLGTKSANELQLVTGAGAIPRLSLDVDGRIATVGGSWLDLGLGNKALILPKGSASERPATGVKGMIRYNLDSNQLEAFGGATPGWGELAVGNFLPTSGGSLSGSLTLASGSNLQLSQGDLTLSDGDISLNSGSITGASGLSGSTTTALIVASGNNQNLDLKASGTGEILLRTQGGMGVKVVDQTSAENYITLRGGAAGSAPKISVDGAAANIPLVLAGKGAGTTEVKASAPAAVALTVKGASAQTANIFEVQTSGSASLMSVDKLGNVGIGTSLPGAPLTIRRPAADDFGQLVIQDTAGYMSHASHKSFVRGLDNVGNPVWQLGVLDNSQKTIQLGAHYSEHSVALVTSATSRLTVLPTGEVGIGTTSPTVAMDVEGETRLRGQATIGRQAMRTDSASRGQLTLSSTYFQTAVAGSNAIDWSRGNIQEVSGFVCGSGQSMSFTNLKDGAAYTLLISGSLNHIGICAISAAGYIFKTGGGAMGPMPGKDVLFTFVVIGTTVVYNMVDNLQ